MVELVCVGVVYVYVLIRSVRVSSIYASGIYSTNIRNGESPLDCRQLLITPSRYMSLKPRGQWPPREFMFVKPVVSTEFLVKSLKLLR